ncbi:hypothetical protein [Peribacillus muralis]|uniref:hypothetical protein n=1 Tax=Peribacillus muralis TaxID=264697 RepID=UPI00070A5844|nr:hypothetical protein [Peribacillus muralis]
MKEKLFSLLVAVIIFFSIFSSSTLALASQEYENSEEIVFEGTSNELHFNSVERDNVITSRVTDAKGNLVSEVKIDKTTNQLEIDGVTLSKEEQDELNNFVEFVNKEYISDSEYFVLGENEDPVIETFSANACSYKSIGTYYSSTAVPKIGVSAFAAYLSTITKSPYSGALAVASVAVGSIPTVYYSLNDAQCTSGNYLYNKRTVKFYKDKARKKQIGKTSVSYQKRFK